MAAHPPAAGGRAGQIPGYTGRLKLTARLREQLLSRNRPVRLSGRVSVTPARSHLRRRVGACGDEWPVMSTVTTFSRTTLRLASRRCRLRPIAHNSCLRRGLHGKALGVTSRLLDASIHRNVGPRGADGRMAHGTCMVCCEDASRGVLAVVAGYIRLTRDGMHASGSYPLCVRCSHPGSVDPYAHLWLRIGRWRELSVALGDYARVRGSDRQSMERSSRGSVDPRPGEVEWP